MLKNLTLTAFRVFWKERAYSLLNLMGLSVGIATSMLIFIFIEGERSVNSFLKDGERLYQMMEHQNYSGSYFTTQANPGPLRDAMIEEMPEIDAFAQFTWEQERLFLLNGQGFKEKGRIANEDFFQIVSTNFIEGDPRNSLVEPDKMYISKSLKERMFGKKKALGATLNVNGWGDYQIDGVFEDIPENSTLRFDFVMPYAPWLAQNSWLKDWGNNGIRGLVKFAPGVDVEAFNLKIKDYVKKKTQGSVVDLFVYPFKDIYLKGSFVDGKESGGRIVYVRLFTVVGIFILVIACINFMNLATARSTKRAKEVGIKKVVGSSRSQLALQFMLESILMAVFSALLAILLIKLILPTLNQMIGKTLNFSIFNSSHSLALLIIVLLVGLLAGSYPALLLSGFKPVSVLKGSFKVSGWSKGVRKGLVVFQFLISIFLIIATIIIQEQIHFIKDKNLGYDKENLVYLPMEGELAKKDMALLFLDRIKQNPNFSHSTVASNLPINISTSTSGGFSWEGKTGDNETLFNVLQIGDHFIEALGMEILEGRDFDPRLATDSLNVIINEQTAKAMNIEDPLNQAVTFWGRQGKVIGIVKDFHFASMQQSIEPIVISLRPEEAEMFIVKMQGGDVDSNLAFLEELTAELNPNYPFTYRFVDESYARQYKSEMVIGQLANAFALITVFISLLGLLGLASYSAEQRIKEIGIRKVLGAGTKGLILQMTRGFVGLVLIGFSIAAPLAYIFMSDWLNDYQYHIQIGPLAFVIAGIASLMITLVIVGYHSLKAANTNPIKSLRYE